MIFFFLNSLLFPPVRPFWAMLLKGLSFFLIRSFCLGRRKNFPAKRGNLSHVGRGYVILSSVVFDVALLGHLFWVVHFSEADGSPGPTRNHGILVDSAA